MDTENKEFSIYRTGTMPTVTAFCNILSELLETDIRATLTGKRNSWAGGATVKYASLQYRILIKCPISLEMEEIGDRIWFIQSSLQNSPESKSIASLLDGLYAELKRNIK